jgi:hypothetical protein
MFFRVLLNLPAMALQHDMYTLFVWSVMTTKFPNLQIWSIKIFCYYVQYIFVFVSIFGCFFIVFVYTEYTECTVPKNNSGLHFKARCNNLQCAQSPAEIPAAWFKTHRKPEYTTAKHALHFWLALWKQKSEKTCKFFSSTLHFKSAPTAWWNEYSRVLEQVENKFQRALTATPQLNILELYTAL